MLLDLLENYLMGAIRFAPMFRGGTDVFHSGPQDARLPCSSVSSVPLHFKGFVFLSRRENQFWPFGHSAHLYAAFTL
jgi:hypothetical protein